MPTAKLQKKIHGGRKIVLTIKRDRKDLPGGMVIVTPKSGRVIATFATRRGGLFRVFNGRLVHRRRPSWRSSIVLHGAHHPLRDPALSAGKGGGVVLASNRSFWGDARDRGTFAGHRAGQGPGSRAGLSTLAVVAAINDTNGGLYMA